MEESSGIIFTLNNNKSEPLLEFKTNGEVYYNYQGEIKKVEEREEILEAFSHTVFGFTGKKPADALFEKFLNKLDKGELSDKQLKMLDKRLRKLKLKNLNNVI